MDGAAPEVGLVVADTERHEGRHVSSPPLGEALRPGCFHRGGGKGEPAHLEAHVRHEALPVGRPHSRRPKGIGTHRPLDHDDLHPHRRRGVGGGYERTLIGPMLRSEPPVAAYRTRQYQTGESVWFDLYDKKPYGVISERSAYR